MGNYNLTAIIVTIGAIFALATVMLSILKITNPYTGSEQTIFNMILDWITPF